MPRNSISPRTTTNNIWPRIHSAIAGWAAPGWRARSARALRPRPDRRVFFRAANSWVSPKAGPSAGENDEFRSATGFAETEVGNDQRRAGCQELRNTDEDVRWDDHAIKRSACGLHCELFPRARLIARHVLGVDGDLLGLAGTRRRNRQNSPAHGGAVLHTIHRRKYVDSDRPLWFANRDRHLEQRLEILPHVQLALLAADEDRYWAFPLFDLFCVLGPNGRIEHRQLGPFRQVDSGNRHTRKVTRHHFR